LIVTGYLGRMSQAVETAFLRDTHITGFKAGVNENATSVVAPSH